MERAHLNGANWDEFSQQHQHQNIKKAPYLMPDQHFFNANKLQI